MTVGRALEQAAQALKAAGVPGHRRDAELLLAQLLGTDRGGLHVRREEFLEPQTASRYQAWIGRRRSRVPLQHVIGKQSFFGYEFKVDRRALVPRPETELLVESALALDLARGARVVDLGTGSGCIAVTLVLERPDLQLHALERSREALELARENAAAHGVAGRVRFVHAAMADAPRDWYGTLDLVVSNPPYVREAEWEALEPEVRDHDPRDALVAGPSGYELYRIVAPLAGRLLRDGGHLLLELGLGQHETVCELIGRSGFGEISVRPDLRGIPRVLAATKRCESMGLQ